MDKRDYNNTEPVHYFCDYYNEWRTEIFKDIPDYEGLYQVSDLGRIKTVFKWLPFRESIRSVKERILIGAVDKYGYKTVSLSKDKKPKTLKIHKLVAIAFLGHVPCKYDEVVDHIDNVKHNNNKTNLQLISHRGNVAKQKESKLGLTGVRKSNSRFRAEIQHEGKYIHIGTYDTPELASNAYQNKLHEITK